MILVIQHSCIELSKGKFEFVVFVKLILDSPSTLYSEPLLFYKFPTGLLFCLNANRFWDGSIVFGVLSIVFFIVYVDNQYECDS